MEVKYGPYPWYFIWSFVLGAALALVYDILRLSRRIMHTHDIVVNIQDVIFFILSGAGMGCVAYFTNNGQIRFYALYGTVLGFVLYRAVIGSRIVNIFVFIFGKIKRLLGFAAAVLLAPFKFTAKRIIKPICMAVGGRVHGFRRRLSSNSPKEGEKIAK